MHPETITLFVTVLIFIISAIFNNFYIYDDRRKRWYIDIVINSNLEKVDKFFEDILKEFKDSHEYLTNNYTEVSVNYLEDKAKHTQALKIIQNRFNFKIIPFFKSYNSSLSIDLKNSLLDFQDIYTESLGIENSRNYDELVKELIESKRKFYEILYRPIKESLISRINVEKLLLYILLIVFIILFTF
jgi:hypothetical protein